MNNHSTGGPETFNQPQMTIPQHYYAPPTRTDSAGSSTPKLPPSVRAETAWLSEDLDHLAGLIDGLEIRMNPLVAPEPLKSDGDSAGYAPASEMVNMIRGQRHTVASLSGRLRRLLDRIEL